MFKSFKTFESFESLKPRMFKSLKTFELFEMLNQNSNSVQRGADKAFSIFSILRLERTLVIEQAKRSNNSNALNDPL